MGNKMTPKQALKDLREDAANHIDKHIVYLNKRLSVIEQALTELEETKILCESFKNDVNRLNQQGIDLYLKYKKQTQILKILKEKVVDIWEILNSVDYNDWLVCYKPTNKKYLLTKEEFDLLKEWLNNE